MYYIIPKIVFPEDDTGLDSLAGIALGVILVYLQKH